MTYHVLLLLMALSFQALGAGMTPSDAFNEGKAFGNANVGTAKSKINSETASTGVPNYTTSHPSSGYYAGGHGSLTAPATANVHMCTSTTGASDPDAHTHGQCESTRMLMKDPGKKNLKFPLKPKTDPITVKRDAVSANAETYLGSLGVSGAYSGCTTKTVKEPDTYQTETCNQYLTAGEESCQEILTVKVTTSESCVPGTWYGNYIISGHNPVNAVDVYCDINRNDGMMRLRFTPIGLHGTCKINYLDVPKEPFKVTDYVHYGRTGTYTCDDYNCYENYGFVNYEVKTIHHWKGSCTVTNYIGYEPGYTQGCVGDTCSYRFRTINSRWAGAHTGTTGSFKPPKIIVTETDSWDNQCGPLEARLP